MSGSVRWLVILIAGGMVLAGCDWGGSAPSAPSTVAAPSETNSVAVILPAAGIHELDNWEHLIRREENSSKTLLEVYRLQPGEPPEKQADLIREAIAKGATGLLVVAADSPAVATALAEARDANIAVVLLDRPVAVAGSPFPLVQYEPEAESAGKLVAALIEDAKNLGFPPGGPAILLTNGRPDEHAKDRAKALRDALVKANVVVLPNVVFFGQEDQAEDALRFALLTNPMVSMVFTDDELGIQAAVKVHFSLDHSQKRFALGGYSAIKWIVDLARTNVVNAVVDRNINDPPAKAFAVLLAVLRGQTVPEVTKIVTPLARATGPIDESRYAEFFAKPVSRTNDLPKEKGKQ